MERELLQKADIVTAGGLYRDKRPLLPGEIYLSPNAADVDHLCRLMILIPWWLRT